MKRAWLKLFGILAVLLCSANLLHAQDIADHWQAAQEATLASSRGRHLSVVTPEEEPHPVALRLDIEGDVDVAVPDLARYETKGLGS